MVQLRMDLCPQKIVNIGNYEGLSSQMIDRWRSLSCPSHFSGSLARYVQTAISQHVLCFLHVPYIIVGAPWHTIRCWKGYRTRTAWIRKTGKSRILNPLPENGQLRPVVHIPLCALATLPDRSRNHLKAKRDPEVTFDRKVSSTHPATPQHGGHFDPSIGARPKIALRSFENSSHRTQTLQNLISSGDRLKKITNL